MGWAREPTLSRRLNDLDQSEEWTDMNRPIVCLAGALALLCLNPLGQAHAQSCAGPVTRVTGDRGYTTFAKFPSNGIVDATGAIWRLSQYPKGRNLWPLRITGTTNTCIRGGAVIGDTPMEITWGVRYANGNAAGIDVGPWYGGLTTNTVVEGMRLHNTGDGIRIGSKARDFVLRGNWITASYDDCIENDGKIAGLAEDNLLDGCFDVFSARNPDTIPRAGAVWTIKNNLARLAPVPGWPSKAPQKGPAHSGVFKWQSVSLPIRLINNVFVLAQGARNQYGSFYDAFSIPGEAAFQLTQWKKYVLESSGNVIVWLGGGAYPFAVPPGFKVTTDKGVWESAKKAWLARHPALARIA
jgi:hypothetical protein